MNRNELIRIWMIAGAALLVIAFWQSFPIMQTMLFSRYAAPRAITPRGDLAASEKTTINIFEQAKNSVVYITTEERVVDLWTRNVYNVPRGTGSGFVWDALGHVVTNYHVIKGASRAIVRLADGRAFPARLVGSAPEHDLAVLRIAVSSNRPPPIPVGTSHDLLVGQSVFAIGNPFGLDWTLTTGIVSALNRELAGDSDGPAIGGLIQTDAAINPGNSGGPLLDSAGRLIGVNTAIYSPSGSSAGIGFAVPVDVVNQVVPQLIATGRYAPPGLGIRIDRRVDAMLARTGRTGVVVLGVEPGGPAALAGLQPARTTPEGDIIPGDIIIGLDGRRINNSDELQAALKDHKPGDKAVLKLLRGDQILTVPVTLTAAGR